MSKMIEIGEVVELHDGEAMVDIQSGDACQSCTMQGHCPLSQGKGWTISAVDPIGAKVGDRVSIEMEGRTYLAAGALVFILPIITLILFYLIGRHLVSEPLAVLAAFVGLFAGTMVAGVIAKGKNGDRFKYKIKEITGRASPRLPFDSPAKGEADETIAKKNS